MFTKKRASRCCNAHDCASENRGTQSVAVGLINLRQRTVRAGGQQQLTFALGKQLSGNECACQPRRVVLAQPSADTACRFEQRALLVIQQTDNADETAAAALRYGLAALAGADVVDF